MLKSYNIEGRQIQEEKLLSEGGYGYILKAIDIRTREVFALKKSYCQGEERTKIAKNELNIMRNLPRHPNLVNFAGGALINENGQFVCLILMEFCSGGSIFDLMAKDPNARLPENQILDIIREIAQGLKAMHSCNPPLAHRDIKIENVLFQAGRCKLCDFGSASTIRLDFSSINQHEFAHYDEEFEKNTTLMYRPPEMADLYLRYQVNEKVDVWMLGCVLFTICFFIHPFQESSKLAISTATYSIPKESRYSEKLKDLIRLLLTPNPKLRPSIFEVEKLLSNYNSMQSIVLNAQAIEIKNRESQLEKEMEQYNKNSHLVKKFNGDIPLDELMKLQDKIKEDSYQPAQQSKSHQQKPRQPQIRQIQQPQQYQQQQQQYQQQQQNQQHYKQQSLQFQQQPQQQQQLQKQNSQNNSTVGNTFWDSFTQQQPSQNQQRVSDQMPNQFGFGFANSNSQSQSPNPFGWDSFSQSPQPQFQAQFAQPIHPSSTNTSGWENATSVSEYSQASTQPSMNHWAAPQIIQQSQSQPQMIDLIGLEDSSQQRQPEKVDLSNIIL